MSTWILFDNLYIYIRVGSLWRFSWGHLPVMPLVFQTRSNFFTKTWWHHCQMMMMMILFWAQFLGSRLFRSANDGNTLMISSRAVSIGCYSNQRQRRFLASTDNRPLLCFLLVSFLTCGSYVQRINLARGQKSDSSLYVRPKPDIRHWYLHGTPERRHFELTIEYFGKWWYSLFCWWKFDFLPCLIFVVADTPPNVLFLQEYELWMLTGLNLFAFLYKGGREYFFMHKHDFWLMSIVYLNSQRCYMESSSEHDITLKHDELVRGHNQ